MMLIVSLLTLRYKKVNGLQLYAIELIIFSLMLLYLSSNVIKKRRHFQVPVGHGNNVELEYAISAHRNFIDYTTFILLAHFILAMIGASALVILILGTLLFIGRILHACSLLHYELMDKRNYKFRIIGMSLTFASLILSNLVLLYRLTFG